MLILFCHNSTYSSYEYKRLLLTLDTYALGAMATKLLESAIDIRWLSTWVYAHSLTQLGWKNKNPVLVYILGSQKKFENFKKSLF